MRKCFKCSAPIRKNKGVIVPATFASWLTGKQACPAERYVACRPCANHISMVSPFRNFREPSIGLPPELHAIAQYEPSTARIIPLPRLAIEIDHDIHEDGQVRAVRAFTHEFIHFWLHKHFDYLVSVQFDNIAKTFDARLIEILHANYPNAGRISPKREKLLKRLKARRKP